MPPLWPSKRSRQSFLPTPKPETLVTLTGVAVCKTIRYMDKTIPVSLRIKNSHLAALARIAQRLGLQRSSAIQLAIAEFIERRGK